MERTHKNMHILRFSTYYYKALATIDNAVKIVKDFAEQFKTC